MQVYPITIHSGELPNGTISEPQVLAIGDFDGVHLGHQEVLRRAVATASRLGLTASVMTFDPHPRAVLGQAKYMDSITPLPDKLKAFEALGLKRAYVVHFDTAFASLPPEGFVDRILMGLQVQTVVIGFDFTFGHKGKGNADTLAAIAKGRFAVEVVRPFHAGEEKVSSTLIRECLQNGQVEKASRLLGRPFSFEGKVVTGEGRGRTIGIPTANLEPTEASVIPGRGVYAIEAHVHGRTYRGVMNIGWKPTFAEEGGQTTLEAHLFDFQDMIYDELVRVRFIGFIRHERKFASAAELVNQIRVDMETAKDLLDKHLL